MRIGQAAAHRGEFSTQADHEVAALHKLQALC